MARIEGLRNYEFIFRIYSKECLKSTNIENCEVSGSQGAEYEDGCL